jgi:Zn-dependent membrane protease YugP
VALTTTHSADNLITDSAAAGTALATGYKTYNNGIGVDADTTAHPSILERAEEAGLATGLVATYAVTHATHYLPIKIRSAIIPVTNFGSRLAVPLIIIGLILCAWENTGAFGSLLAYTGIICFALTAVFQLVTLPTEFNASRRAMQALEHGGILSGDELHGARKVLTAAAMTYVAALAVSLAQLLRLLIIVAGSSRRRS